MAGWMQQMNYDLRIQLTIFQIVVLSWTKNRYPLKLMVIIVVIPVGSIAHSLGEHFSLTALRSIERICL